jgi:hypothetical protein
VFCRAQRQSKAKHQVEFLKTYHMLKTHNLLINNFGSGGIGNMCSKKQFCPIVIKEVLGVHFLGRPKSHSQAFEGLGLRHENHLKNVGD